ncbi:MAG: 6-bladed beta-propeller [Planctomycetota bacterium]
MKPVFFPPAPDKPRLQFLKSFSNLDDLGAAGMSTFEKFVLGEPEMQKGIQKPFGIAMFEGKLYVCDTAKRMVEIIDLENKTFSYLTKDRRLRTPLNIYIEDDGTKYITDSTGGAVFVFDREDNLTAILGRELNIAPFDLVVRGQRCYLTDTNKHQVVILDKRTGEEILRIGTEGDGPGQFNLINGITLDEHGNIYVTDGVNARITEFDNSGKLRRTFGKLSNSIHDFVRPKSISIDKDGNIWIVDTSTEVTKIYNSQAQLLMFFGLPGNLPGMMNLPAKVILDYDHVELFREYAVEGADIEFLVLVTNQYGPNKISVYGFGSFPEPVQSAVLGQETE